MSPYASVIIASYYSALTISTTLDSLSRQTSRDFETIVVNSSPDAAEFDRLKAAYPDVHFYQHPERLLMHAARNKGVELARGTLLLFTDPDLELHPHWVEKMSSAHRAGHHFLVGEMDCLDTDWRSLGIHITKYHFLLPGIKHLKHHVAPTASAGYDADLFTEIGIFPSQLVCGDAVQSWKAWRAGYTLNCVRDVPVSHIHDQNILDLIRERISRGFEYRSEQARFFKWSRRKLWLLVVLAPLLPFQVLLRSAGDSLSAKWFLRYLYTLPVQCAGHFAWSLGETIAAFQLLRRM